MHIPSHLLGNCYSFALRSTKDPCLKSNNVCKIFYMLFSYYFLGCIKLCEGKSNNINCYLCVDFMGNGGLGYL